MPLKAIMLVPVSLALISCATPQVQPAPPERTPGWTDAVVAAVGERRVLQLGESGHGMAETYRLKMELVRELHQQHGFDVLAVEGGLAECWVAAQHLGEWSAEQSMQACFWDAWASEEAAALF